MEYGIKILIKYFYMETEIRAHACARDPAAGRQEKKIFLKKIFQAHAAQQIKHTARGARLPLHPKLKKSHRDEKRL